MASIMDGMILIILLKSMFSSPCFLLAEFLACSVFQNQEACLCSRFPRFVLSSLVVTVLNKFISRQSHPSDRPSDSNKQVHNCSVLVLLFFLLNHSFLENSAIYLQKATSLRRSSLLRLITCAIVSAEHLACQQIMNGMLSMIKMSCNRRQTPLFFEVALSFNSGHWPSRTYHHLGFN